MKGLFLGIVFIVIIGFGGLVYRNIMERPLQPIACPIDSFVCPDGTPVSRTGNSCTFAACPPPNVSLPDAGISFALPAGFSAIASPDAASVAAYALLPEATSTNAADAIIIRRFPIAASSTALATIQQTAISGASGLPVSPTSFTSTQLGNYRFTIVAVERFEGVIDTAFYLARATDVLRFDAVDVNVPDWTDTSLNVAALPAHAALTKLLTTLQGQ